ncbi:MAG: division/cell wall cluster transcriptional repressor MraZ [Prevotella sp.]|nr:division/cell wall cluster transcriptional repressor MraZ [Prevotella sp.]MDD7273820.1 division/cell wall cluster transcriptional repressor MraZ [Prevotellaceae bacterium]MDY3935374.1 division/cell wall cluster transcriptional repressor MraZ [Prevotella sp.]MDY4218768.1 division/cell wall cluster transcriptional repressor MraZ [Prevotella sp.]
MRFLGSIEAKADTKGRVFLPATFRKMLNTSGEEMLIMRKDVFQPCLVLYPESVWNSMVDTLRKKLNRWNKRDQAVYRQFVSDVEAIALDGNGRFLIPKRYQEMANIDQQVRFIGMDDCIEIWSNQHQTAMTPEDFSQALEELMCRDDKDATAETATNGEL